MVFYFHPRGFDATQKDFLIYMGKDKFENEDLIRYSIPLDVWWVAPSVSAVLPVTGCQSINKWWLLIAPSVCNGKQVPCGRPIICACVPSATARRNLWGHSCWNIGGLLSTREGQLHSGQQVRQCRCCLDTCEQPEKDCQHGSRPGDCFLLCKATCKLHVNDTPFITCGC